MARKKIAAPEQTEEQPAEPKTGWLTGYLRRTIEESGLSQFEIARRAGIAPQQLYRFMKENKTLTLDTVDKIMPVVSKHFGLKLMSVEVARTQIGKTQQELLGYLSQLQDSIEDLKSLVIKGIEMEED